MAQTDCKCGARLQAPDGAAGSSARCPACKAAIVVGDADELPTLMYHEGATATPRWVMIGERIAVVAMGMEAVAVVGRYNISSRYSAGNDLFLGLFFGAPLTWLVFYSLVHLAWWVSRPPVSPSSGPRSATKQGVSNLQSLYLLGLVALGLVGVGLVGLGLVGAIAIAASRSRSNPVPPSVPQTQPPVHTPEVPLETSWPAPVNDRHTSSAPPVRPPATTPRLSTWSRGSTKSEVLEVQGRPIRIDSAGEHLEVWHYGLSHVTFTYGNVHEWKDAGDLRVR